MPWWWLAAAIVGLFFIGLSWSIISDWFAENKDLDSDYGELIKEYCSNGNYRVIAGVFNKYGTCTKAQAWETEQLDGELNDIFGNSSRIRINL